MNLKKTPAQRQFENEVQRENDRIDEIRASTIVRSIITFFALCFLYSLIFN